MIRVKALTVRREQEIKEALTVRVIEAMSPPLGFTEVVMNLEELMEAAAEKRKEGAVLTIKISKETKKVVKNPMSLIYRTIPLVVNFIAAVPMKATAVRRERACISIPPLQKSKRGVTVLKKEKRTRVVEIVRT